MSELPLGWAEADLVQLVGAGGLVTDGDWIESKDQDPEGDVRLIQLMDLGDGHFRDRSRRYLTSVKAAELGCTYLAPGDVLVARMPDPLGRACVFPGIGQPAVTAVDVLVWRAGPQGADPRWLASAINSPNVRDVIAASASGTTRQRVAGGQLKQLRLPVPPLPEQRRIVAKIDALTARSKRARAELQRTLDIVDRQRRAILQAAFSSQSDEIVGADRPAGVDIRIAKLPALPPGWAWSPFSQMAAISGGLTKNPTRASAREQVPYLRVANVYADRLDLREVKSIGSDAREIAKCQLEPGDLLIVEGNGSIDQIGRVAVWRGELERCVHQNHLIRARPSPLLISKYALYWLLSPLGRQFIESVASSGAGLHTLSVSKIAGLPVPICALPEQRAIVARIETAFAALDRVEAEALAAERALDRLDQAILAKAFRGELVPQDPADEPASALLARIAAERAATPKPARGRRRTTA